MESKPKVNKNYQGGLKHKTFNDKNLKKVCSSNQGLVKFYHKYEKLINLILDMIAEAENM